MANTANTRATGHPIVSDHPRELVCQLSTYKAPSYGCIVTRVHVGTVAPDGVFESAYAHDYQRLYFHHGMTYGSQQNIDKAHSRVEDHLSHRTDLPGIGTDDEGHMLYIGEAIAAHYRINRLTLAGEIYYRQHPNN